MVLDLNLLDVPNATLASRETNDRLIAAFRRLCRRKIGQMVEEQLMQCHSPEKAAAIAADALVLSEELRQPDRRELDDAVFELQGVSEAERRKELVDRLHAATAEHFRQIRVVEIQKMQQRSKSKVHRSTTLELASDAWDAVYYKNEPPLSQWLVARPGPTVSILIPSEGVPRLLDEGSMFDKETVYFGKDRGAAKIVCASRAQAELVARFAELGLRGDRRLPEGENECREVLAKLDTRIADAEERIRDTCL